MKGSPLVRAVLVFLAILSLGWPLHSLTRMEEQKNLTAAAETQAVSVTPDVQTVELQLSFTRRPKWFEVSHLGRVVWRQDNSGQQETKSLYLSFPKEGIELQLRAELEGAGVSAVRCRLTSPQGESYERSVWGEERINAVLAFP